MDTIPPYDFSHQDVACDYCHKRKMRCDKHKPQCLECLKRNMPCNYGLRLKRGPKSKKQQQTVVPQPRRDRIQKIRKSNSNIQAILFELEFNKKMVEIWKGMCLNENGNLKSAKRIPPPKFDPVTEGFIRSPNAIQLIMDEFNSSFRTVFYLPETNMDFATKIWQALIEISLPDLLRMLNTFDTSLLLSVVEYFIVFILCKYF